MGKSAKGSDYERELCVRFSMWWAGREDIFWRSSGSGARAKTRGRSGRQTSGQHGDIACTDPIGAPLIDLLTIELKRGYSSRSPYDAIDRADTAAIQEWELFLAQAIESHEQAGSYAWCMITRRDRRESFIWMPQHLLTDLRGVGAFARRPRPCVSLVAAVRYKRKPTRWVSVFGCPLDCFLEAVSPEHITALSQVT